MKKPFGNLISGNRKEIASFLKETLTNGKYKYIITVGDEVISTFNSIGLHPKLYIYDEKIRRKSISKTAPPSKIIKIKNPSGTLTEEALNSVKLALKSNVPLGLKVEGEEDLLTLPAILYAPLGALVAYGQPEEGVVLVKVTKGKKETVRKIIKKMRVIT